MENEFSWGKAIGAGALAVLVTAVVAVLYALIVNATIGPAMTPQPPDQELGAVTFIFYGIAAAVFTAIGAVIFVLMMRFGGANAMRNFTIVAIIGLILSFVTLLQPGIDTQSRLILGIAHVVAAAAAIPTFRAAYQR